jgi:hypothetical protein
MYSGDMSGTQWEQDLEMATTELSRTLTVGYLKWKKWNDLTYGLTATQIAALPAFSGKTAADMTKYMAAFTALQTMYQLFHGLINQPTAYDYSGNIAAF